MQYRTASKPAVSGVLALLAMLIIATLPAAADSTEEKETAGMAEPDLPDPLAAGWQGKNVCEKLFQDDLQRVLRCRFEPGVGHEKHYHDRHFGYALSGGKMRIMDASGIREVELKTGSHFASAGTDWHQVVNIGDTTVTYLIVEPLGD